MGAIICVLLWTVGFVFIGTLALFILIMLGCAVDDALLGGRITGKTRKWFDKKWGDKK